MSDDQSRYVVCIRCAHVMPFFMHEALRVAVDCPTCSAPKQFGPGIYVEDFHGYTMDEVMKRRAGVKP